MVLKKFRLELTLEQDFVFPPENDLPKCLVTSPQEYSAQQLIGHIWPGKKRCFFIHYDSRVPHPRRALDIFEKQRNLELK